MKEWRKQKVKSKINFKRRMYLFHAPTFWIGLRIAPLSARFSIFFQIWRNGSTENNRKLLWNKTFLSTKLFYIQKDGNQQTFLYKRCTETIKISFFLHQITFFYKNGKIMNPLSWCDLYVKGHINVELKLSNRKYEKIYIRNDIMHC